MVLEKAVTRCLPSSMMGYGIQDTKASMRTFMVTAFHVILHRTLNRAPTRLKPNLFEVRKHRRTSTETLAYIQLVSKGCDHNPKYVCCVMLWFLEDCYSNRNKIEKAAHNLVIEQPPFSLRCRNASETTRHDATLPAANLEAVMSCK